MIKYKYNKYFIPTRAATAGRKLLNKMKYNLTNNK